MTKSNNNKINASNTCAHKLQDVPESRRYPIKSTKNTHFTHRIPIFHPTRYSDTCFYVRHLCTHRLPAHQFIDQCMYRFISNVHNVTVELILFADAWSIAMVNPGAWIYWQLLIYSEILRILSDDWDWMLEFRVQFALAKWRKKMRLNSFSIRSEVKCRALRENLGQFIQFQCVTSAGECTTRKHIHIKKRNEKKCDFELQTERKADWSA